MVIPDHSWLISEPILVEPALELIRIYHPNLIVFKKIYVVPTI